MKLLEGKKGLILGVLNDKSIAWGIAKELAEIFFDLVIYKYVKNTFWITIPVPVLTQLL